MFRKFINNNNSKLIGIIQLKLKKINKKYKNNTQKIKSNYNGQKNC